MKELTVLRAEEEWQRAGAYSVRIEGMNRQHHISLREEFDEHDGEGTRYIVLLDELYPVATCRFYELDEKRVMIGRVVVLPEYRGKGLGCRVITEAEKWITELGYEKICIESRVEVKAFYEKLGYHMVQSDVVKSGVFDCIRMEKTCIFLIRPHHGMCIYYFRGNGYSPEFTVHMKEMIEIFKENPKVKLVLHADEICSACPNDHDGICETNEKVLRYDNGVLDTTGLKEGMVLEVQEFFAAVQEKVIRSGVRGKICGDCQWNYICEALEEDL